MASNQVQKAKSSEVQPQNGAQASMLNQTPFPMTLSRSINWSGTPALPGFPDTIPPNNNVLFNHLSDGDFGSRGAVIYNGLNATGYPCAWVFAWDAPAESENKPNKVYVDCGLRSEIDNIELNQIRLMLNASTSSAQAADPVSRTVAAASINDQVPDKATVEASFAFEP